MEPNILLLYRLMFKIGGALSSFTSATTCGGGFVRSAHVLVLLDLEAYLDDASGEEEVVQHYWHDAGDEGGDDDVGG